MKPSDNVTGFLKSIYNGTKAKKGWNNFLNVIWNVIIQDMHAIWSNIYVKILVFCPLGTQAKSNNINELLVHYSYQTYFRIAQKRCISLVQPISISTESVFKALMVPFYPVVLAYFIPSPLRPTFLNDFLPESLNQDRIRMTRTMYNCKLTLWELKRLSKFSIQLKEKLTGFTFQVR